ncbi:PP2C family protein-serine/threonine phosphatase [Sphaerisporangium rubeum]|uniref:Serine phosphatase RsbU (Regulator of sigma subunit) n=1 Tax=Sphaerisporangium rubeum TaxID=321317 RepID=A0A7X0I9V7_9ACTN|nr:SpoIIE family protein phosphatase [Sphaerisporangium rubeum]MBB6471145.1 serine phosphatase RsbU (regulator of sigma subunit) [Sphaerisporangium rubeum]
MTNSSRGVLAASFVAGKAALPDAKRFTQEVLTAWAATPVLADAERLTEEFVSEVGDVPFEILWGHQGGSVQIELRQRADDDRVPAAPAVPVATWGVTFTGTQRATWARLDLPQRTPRPVDAGMDAEPHLRGPGWLGYLADASDLLAGTLDPGMVPALIAQIVVPRLATWCAVYTADNGGGEQTLAYLWHADESEIDDLREQLADAAIPPADDLRPRPISLPAWQSLAFPLVAKGRSLGVMCLGRGGRFPDDIAQLAEDLARRAALAMDNARLYAQQADANRALQRSLLPPGVPAITPGLDYSVVYEPAGETNEVGGDFYDLFATGEGTWRFAIGDVCGTGPEAAAVTGLARHTLRLLARENYDVAAVVSRLNRAILEEGERARFLTLLHGEITRTGDGLELSLISAGHPEALRLRPTGVVDAVVTAQSLLGVFPEAEFEAERVVLAPGDVLLGVTDGVTERRSGSRLLDDDGGLPKLLAECVDLSARAVAERIHRAVQDFAAEPSADDLAILVLRAEGRDPV